MKKVFVIDDDIPVREAMREKIDCWKSEGFVYSGDAPDGEVALAAIEQIKPDIVITDIEMPFMNGLEVSRFLKVNMPSVKVVVMSGHDQFQYAREALRNGVMEYCLKPISFSELIEVLKRVANQIDAEKQSVEAMELMKRKAEDSDRVSREKLFRDLCFGIIHKREALQAASELNLNLQSGYFSIIVVQYSHCSDHNRTMDSQFLKEIKSLLQSRLRSQVYFQSSPTDLVWLVRGRTVQDVEQLVKGFVHKDVLHLEEMLNCRISLGIGGVKDGPEHILHSYHEAVSNIKHCGIKESMDIDRERLVEFIQTGEEAEVESLVKQYMASFKDTDWPHPFGFKERMNNKNHSIIIKAQAYIERNYYDRDLSLNKAAEYVGISPSYFSTLFSQETGKTFTEYLTSVRMNHAAELLKTSDAKIYEIAYMVGYHDAHYFSTIFKKTTGMKTKDFRKSEQFFYREN